MKLCYNNIMLVLVAISIAGLVGAGTRQPGTRQPGTIVEQELKK